MCQEVKRGAGSLLGAMHRRSSGIGKGVRVRDLDALLMLLNMLLQ